MLLYDKSGVEVLTVGAVRVDADIPTLEWTLPIAGAGFTKAFDGSDPDVGAAKLGRGFRLFGAEAPPVVVVAQRRTQTDATTTFLNTAQVDFTRAGDGAATGQLTLDGRPPGLKPGARVIVTGPAAAVPFEVTAVANVKAERKAKSDPVTNVTPVEAVAVSGAATRLTLAPLGTRKLDALADDIRTITVHELAGPGLRFWPYEFRAALAERAVHLVGMRAGWSSLAIGGAVLDTGDLETGRRVLLIDERGGVPTPATVVGPALIAARVGFAPAPADAATVRALGLAPDQTTPLTVLVSAQLPEQDPAAAPPARVLSDDRVAPDADRDVLRRDDRLGRPGDGGHARAERDPRRAARRADVRRRACLGRRQRGGGRPRRPGRPDRARADRGRSRDRDAVRARRRARRVPRRRGHGARCRAPAPRGQRDAPGRGGPRRPAGPDDLRGRPERAVARRRPQRPALVRDGRRRRGRPSPGRPRSPAAPAP